MTDTVLHGMRHTDDYAHEVDFDWGAEALEPLSMAGRLAERTPRERVREEAP